MLWLSLGAKQAYPVIAGLQFESLSVWAPYPAQGDKQEWLHAVGQSTATVLLLSVPARSVH